MDIKRVTFFVFGILFLLAMFFFVVRFTGFFVFGNTGVNSCFDSDGGKNYGDYGRVGGEKHALKSESFFEEDKCLDDKTLLEYYCVSAEDKINSYKFSKEYICKNKCEDGRCAGEDMIETALPCDRWCKVRQFFR